VSVVATRGASPAELHAALDGQLRERLGTGVRSVTRRPHAYRTSFPLEELDAVLEDGRTLALVWKDLGFDGLRAGARLAKDPSLHDPRREIEAYRLLDRAGGLGTPALYGAASDESLGRHWLFLERVDGLPLWQVGDRAVWEAAAAWLGRFHRTFLGIDPGPRTSLLLPDRARSLDRMSRAVRQTPGRRRSALGRIAERYGEVVDHLAALPRTLVHGDFHASNVMVDPSNDPPRIAPTDWETAGLGPGLLDLAGLTSGGWPEPDRAAMVSTYRSAASDDRPDAEFLPDLERCRLHHAVQLLSLPGTWTPPAEHAHDWLGEAVGSAERLGLL
jgi:Phosphotransferase enzyme family